jgi:hypothetical protein
MAGFVGLGSSWIGHGAAGAMPAGRGAYAEHEESYLTPQLMQHQLNEYRSVVSYYGRGAAPDGFVTALSAARQAGRRYEAASKPNFLRKIFSIPAYADPQLLAFQTAFKNFLPHVEKASNTAPLKQDIVALFP